MSDEAPDLPRPERDAASSPESGAEILRFPSNRPLDAGGDDTDGRLFREVLGDVLRAERHRQERTLADVATDAAVSLPYLSEVERGRKEVSSDLLDAIGTALELPLVEILERSAERLRGGPQMSTDSADLRMQHATSFRLAA